ncbi:MAG: tripartite tricarboxylate transporter substrate binding protein [Lachnospiraceae bacterium]
MRIKILCGILGIAMAAVLTTGCAKAKDEFPKKEITLVVPWNPGGTNDLMARALQPVFKEKFNAERVVKNSAGGGSAVGITEVLTSKADGYTVGLASSSFLALVAQGKAEADLDKVENICLVAEEPIVLVAKNGGRFEDAQSFIDEAKAAPGMISVGVPGSNNVNQAYATLLGQAANTEFLFMPFDGGARVITEILGGHVDAGVLKPSEVISQVKSGDLVILGVFNQDGLPIMPEVPTFETLGYDVFSLGVLKQVSYIMAPAGLDDAVKEKLASMFKEALESDDFKTFADESGLVSQPITGEELNTCIGDIYKGLENASREIWVQ